LALAQAVWRARRSGRPALVLADEFGSTLDRPTAWMLARQVRRIARREKLAFLLATPHDWLRGPLQPDRLIIKPLGEEAHTIASPPEPHGPDAFHASPPPEQWPIRPGTIADYRALAQFHYLAGAPAAHVRVWAIDTPGSLQCAGGPAIAAACVVSPPTPNVRARHLLFPGRYAGADKRAGFARLNAELECISRVVVHPVFRAAGLAGRLVRHAIATAATPHVEALAAMGMLHPLFERAGMKAFRPPPSQWAERLASAAEIAGLSAADLAAVGPVRRFLRAGPADRREFFAAELDFFARKVFGRRLDRCADRLPAVCRKAVAAYVYYFI
jgi:hypothetical protein